MSSESEHDAFTNVVWGVWTQIHKASTLNGRRSYHTYSLALRTSLASEVQQNCRRTTAGAAKISITGGAAARMWMG